MIGLAGLAVLLFVSTNADDLILLVALLAEPGAQTRRIVVGQFAGMFALLLVSATVSMVSLVLPQDWIGLLGLVPIILGFKKLIDLWRRARRDDPEAVQAGGRSAMAVAAITVASGGDNIGVYTPVFATRSSFEIMIIGAVATAMTAVWLCLAVGLVRHSRLGTPLRAYGDHIVPFILIGLGTLVLHESGSVQLLEHWLGPAAPLR